MNYSLNDILNVLNYLLKKKGYCYEKFVLKHCNDSFWIDESNNVQYRQKHHQHFLFGIENNTNGILYFWFSSSNDSNNGYLEDVVLKFDQKKKETNRMMYEYKVQCKINSDNEFNAIPIGYWCSKDLMHQLIDMFKHVENTNDSLGIGCYTILEHGTSLEEVLIEMDINGL